MCVFFEFSAFWADFTVLGVVVSFAVGFNHVGYGFVFAYHAFVGWVWGLRLHLASTIGKGVVST